MINVSGPPHGQGQLGAGGGQRDHGTPKRGREGEEADGRGQFQFPRRPRKVTYGKSKVMVEGAEAAPIEIFVGNTNSRVLHQHIVMKQCANELTDKIPLEVIVVKCLTNYDLYPNARTKCWKLTVPYKFKELMMNDELYPAGWSHRQFYAPKQNKTKKQKDDGLSNEASGVSKDGSNGGA